MIITPKDRPEGSSPYRLRRGTKASELPPQPPAEPVPPLASLNGPFHFAEYLSLKVRHDTHDVKGLVDVPGERGGAKGQDKDVWIYEHLRRIPIDLTPLLTSLIGTCTKETCPQMKVDEWMFLCVAHNASTAGTDACCAIDYILHTVDSTTTLLNSSKTFPSRMHVPPSSLSHFPSLFRRLSRIFSHAYFHHREVFSLAEAETSLYARFAALCERYDLVGANLLVIPKEAVVTFARDQPADTADEESDEEESDESEEAEEQGEGEGEGDEQTDAAGRERREAREAGTGGKGRTHSLDRGSLPRLDDMGRRDRGGKAEPAPTPFRPKEEKGSGGFDPALGGGGAANVDRGMTITRRTLGRGKQSRGTMLWSSDSAAVPEEAVAPAATISTAGSASARTAIAAAGASASSGGELESLNSGETQVGGRERSDSVNSAIHIPSAEEGAEGATSASGSRSESDSGAVGGPEGEAEDVSKDEIELLEEQGKPTQEPAVSPMPPSAEPQTQRGTTSSPARTSEEQGKEDDGLEEVKLDEAPASALAPSETKPVPTASSSPVRPGPSLKSAPTVALSPARSSKSPERKMKMAAASPVRPTATSGAEGRSTISPPEKQSGQSVGSTATSPEKARSLPSASPEKAKPPPSATPEKISSLKAAASVPPAVPSPLREASGADELAEVEGGEGGEDSVTEEVEAAE